jgi:hypothetical protein
VIGVDRCGVGRDNGRRWCTEVGVFTELRLSEVGGCSCPCGLLFSGRMVARKRIWGGTFWTKRQPRAKCASSRSTCGAGGGSGTCVGACSRRAFANWHPTSWLSKRRLSATATTRLPTSSVAATKSSTRPIGRPPWAETESIGPLLFVNHLPNWQLIFEHERELQTVIAARTIDEICERRDGLHVVLAGDLDATPDAASVRFLRGRQSLGGRRCDALGVSFHPGFIAACSNGNWVRVSQVPNGRI